MVFLNTNAIFYSYKYFLTPSFAQLVVSCLHVCWLLIFHDMGLVGISIARNITDAYYAT